MSRTWPIWTAAIINTLVAHFVAGVKDDVTLFYILIVSVIGYSLLGIVDLFTRLLETLVKKDNRNDSRTALR